MRLQLCCLLHAAAAARSGFLNREKYAAVDTERAVADAGGATVKVGAPQHAQRNAPAPVRLLSYLPLRGGSVPPRRQTALKRGSVAFNRSQSPRVICCGPGMAQPPADADMAATKPTQLTAPSASQ